MESKFAVLENVVDNRTLVVVDDNSPVAVVGISDVSLISMLFSKLENIVDNRTLAIVNDNSPTSC
jgi:hypothetical protein